MSKKTRKATGEGSIYYFDLETWKQQKIFIFVFPT